MQEPAPFHGVAAGLVAFFQFMDSKAGQKLEAMMEGEAASGCATGKRIWELPGSCLPQKAAP